MDWNCTGSQRPISYLLLLLLWMKIHGPFQKDGFSTWIVNENTSIELPNYTGSCQIAIISHGKKTWSQPFNSSSMVASINIYMMTQEELADQQRLMEEEQERKDALKKAHYSSPQTCCDECTFCENEGRCHDLFFGSGRGT